MSGSLFLVRLFSLVFSLSIGTSVATLMMYRMLANILAPVAHLLQTQTTPVDQQSCMSDVRRPTKSAVCEGLGPGFQDVQSWWTPSDKACPHFVAHRVQLPFLSHSTPRRALKPEPTVRTSSLRHDPGDLSRESSFDLSAIANGSEAAHECDSSFDRDFLESASGFDFHDSGFIQRELNEIRDEIMNMGEILERLATDWDDSSRDVTADEYLWDYHTDLVAKENFRFVFIGPVVPKAPFDDSDRFNYKESCDIRTPFSFRSLCSDRTALYTSDLYIDDGFPDL